MITKDMKENNCKITLSRGIYLGLNSIYSKNDINMLYTEYMG